jgi:uncharacterized membrane protein
MKNPSTLKTIYYFIGLFIWAIVLSIPLGLIDASLIYSCLLGILYAILWFSFIEKRIVSVHNYIFPKYKVDDES